MNFAQKPRPLTRESQTWKVFQRRLNKEELLELALQQAARSANKLIHVRKEQDLE